MAKNNSGYIKLDRSLLESEIWQEKPFDRGKAWVDLLMLANWKDHDVIRRGTVEHRKRGDVNCSIGWLANRWGWSANKVRRYIRQLNRLGMCTSSGTPNGTTLTIENYTFYQDGRRTHGTPNGTLNGTSDGTTDGTYEKNSKEGERIANNARARGGGKNSWNPFLDMLRNGEIEDD